MNLLLISSIAMPYNEVEAILEEKSILRIPTVAMPIGLMEMGAYVREKSCISNIQILDCGKEMGSFYINKEKLSSRSYQHFLRSLLDKVEFTPDVVGVSLMFACARKSSLETAEIAKEKWKNCTTILGGNTATGMYKKLLDEECVDYVVRGEGELSLTEFINSLNDSIKNINVQGVYDKVKASRGVEEISPMIEDLDELPMPAFDLLDLDFYCNTPFYGRGSVMFSRGCPFKCTFCGSSLVHGRRVRHKSNKKCLSEVKYLLDYGFKHIKPEDDIWAIRKKKFMELADEIAKIRGNCLFELSQGLSVAVMDEERIDAMMRMGVKGAQLAIESGSPYIQKHIIKKNVNLDKAKKLLDYMRKVGFVAEVNFIFGFPGETDAMRKESIEYMKSLDVNWIYVFNCAPIPGTELFKEFEKVADMDSVDWDNMRVGRRLFDTIEITTEELENIAYDTNIEINFFNNCNMRNGRYELAIQCWNEIILNNYPFHTVGRYCRAIAYSKLKRMDDATADLRICVDWIRKNSESKRLFERYRAKMPLLEKLMENEKGFNLASELVR